MVTRLVNGTPRNYPTKPQIPVAPGLTFPSDLFAPTADGQPNKFYTSIRMRTASFLSPARLIPSSPLLAPFGLGSTQVQNTLNNIANTVGNADTGPAINLPIPRKINDVQVLTWSQESTTSLAASLGVNLANFLGGATGAGVIINPALFMLFKHPNFKSFEFSWTFVADNEQESRNIARIIDRIKFHSSPRNDGVLMRYPDVFHVQLHPDPRFTFRIKPSIVEAVAADYSGGEVPAFYKNGAPVAVNLTIRFKEIEIWEKRTWGSNEF